MYLFVHEKSIRGCEHVNQHLLVLYCLLLESLFFRFQKSRRTKELNPHFYCVVFFYYFFSSSSSSSLSSSSSCSPSIFFFFINSPSLLNQCYFYYIIIIGLGVVNAVMMLFLYPVIKKVTSSFIDF